MKLGSKKNRLTRPLVRIARYFVGLALLGMSTQALANHAAGNTYTFTHYAPCLYKTATPEQGVSCQFRYSTSSGGTVIEYPWASNQKYGYLDYKNTPGVTHGSQGVAGTYQDGSVLYQTIFNWSASHRLRSISETSRRLSCPAPYAGSRIEYYLSYSWESQASTQMANLYSYSGGPPKEKHLRFDDSDCKLPNAAPSIAATAAISLNEDTVGTHTVTVTDPDAGDTHTLQVTQEPANGAVTSTNSGKNFILSYKPNKDWNGTDTIKVQVTDSAGAKSSLQTLTITVKPVNDAPSIPAAGTLSISEDGSGTHVVVVTDPDLGMPSDSHTLQVIQHPVNGSVTPAKSGNDFVLNYKPNQDWNGTETIKVQVTDSAGAKSAVQILTVTVTPVNDAPSIPGSAALTINEDTTGTHTVVITDPDFGRPGDSHTLDVIEAPKNGTLAAAKSGNNLVVSYQPNKDWNGTEVIKYRVKDQAGAFSGAQALTITVKPVNDAPSIPASAAVAIDEDTVGTHTVVITDPDFNMPGDSHSLETLLAPVNGVVSNVKSGNNFILTYTPNKDWIGTETIKVRVRDQSGAVSGEQTITITVRPINDAPVIAATASITIDEDTVGNYTVVITDPDAGDSHTLEVYTKPSNGIASFNGNKITYTPNKDWNGQDVLRVRAKDSAGAYSEVLTLTITVTPVNDAPSLLEKHTALINEGGVYFYSPVITDPDIGMPHDEHTIIIVDAPVRGSAVLNGTQIVYTPNEYWNGIETITIQVKDKAGLLSEPQVVLITVQAVNNPPSIADTSSFTIKEDVSLNTTVEITDPDLNMPFDEHEFVMVKHPANGSFTFDNETKEVVYTPNQDWYGTEVIEFQVKDQAGALSGTQVMTITVTPTPDAPSDVGLTDGYISVEAGKVSQWYDIYVVDVDLPEDSHAYQVSGDMHGGAVEIAGSKIRFTAGSDYAGKLGLTITATDSFGLSVSRPLSVYVRKLTHSGTISMPAVKGALYGKNGDHAIVTAELEGTISPYTVRVHEDSPVGIMLGNLQLLPGQEAVLGAGAHQKANNALSLPVGALETGTDYSAVVEIIPDDFRFPALAYTLVFKKIETELAGVQESYLQVFDNLNVQVQHKSDYLCRLTIQQSLAETHDPIRQPVCLVEWVNTPDESDLAAYRDAANTLAPALTGNTVQPGEQSIAYNVYMYTGIGDRQLVQTVEKQIRVDEAYGKVTVVPNKELNPILYMVEHLSLGLTNTSGIKCTLTRTQSVSSANTKFCNVEWTTIPSGFQEVLERDQPELSGHAETESDALFSWNTYTISPKGTRVELGSGSAVVGVIAPQGPSIAIESSYKYGDVFAIPLDRRLHLGTAKVDANGPADLFVETVSGSGATKGYDYLSGYSNESNIVRVFLEADHEGDVYSKHQHSIYAAYLRMPSAETTEVINYQFVPATGVSPYFKINVDKVLDTETLPVTVTMTERSNYSNTYHPDYGNWDIQIYEVIRKMGEEARYVPVSEVVRMSEDGTANFDLDLSTVSATNTRLIARATLVHDIEGYVRETESKQIYVSVLYGGEVEGQVYGKRLSGPAPFNAYLQYQPFKDDPRAARALGSTIWEVSADDGQTWDRTEPSARPQFARTFEKGKYLVRAIASNKHSGVAYNSEIIELIVYNNPVLAIEGDKEVFVGDTADISVTASYQGEPLDLDAVTIEWSTDKARTFEPGNNEYVATRDSPGAYQLSVRVKEATAPADDRYAWTTYKVNPRFHAVRGPKVGLRGPRKMEYGKAYEIAATATPRVKGLKGTVRGHFILPDGSTVEGESVLYEPTKEDVESSRVNLVYKAWFEDFEDKGGVTERALNMRVWEYVWPSFTLESQGTIRYAPTKAILSLRNSPIPTPIEDATYVWNLPEGVTITKDRGNRLEIDIAKGGDLEFSVTVSDGRGNETTAALSMNLEDAPAWIVESEVKYSNEMMREPLSVSYRPTFKGGHPKDRIGKKTFFVNGEMLKSGGITAKAELPAGVHVISVEMLTRYGHTVTDEIEVEVLANKVPVCTVETQDVNGRWRVEPDCHDEDGVVRRILWNVGGSESSGSKYKTFIQSRITEPTLVQVRAVDDSGGVSEPVSVTLEPVEKGESSGKTEPTPKPEPAPADPETDAGDED